MSENLQVLVELRAIAAKKLAITLCLPGFDTDYRYAPVPLCADDGCDEQRYVVRGLVSEEHAGRLWQHPNVADIYVDNEIAPFPVSLESLVSRRDDALEETNGDTSRDCDPTTSGGNLADVAAHLGAPSIWKDGVCGDGIVVGVVDGGITARQRVSSNQPKPIDRVIGGWPRANWGTACRWGFHGNMSATDILGIAPHAKLYDIRISDAPYVAGRVSDALAGFQWAIETFQRNGTPQILANSWGLYQQAWGPVYASDSSHPFTRKVVEAIDTGILVLFAAGDCGGTCPSKECGADCGPGSSIWGANGHSKVMTIGAATLNETLAGYSSQGPAALDDRKPDFCGITHFTGYTHCDSGTSAACSVAAGVVALLKQAQPLLSQHEAKSLLQRTAKPVLGGTGWNRLSGAGIIRAANAYACVMSASLT